MKTFVAIASATLVAIVAGHAAAQDSDAPRSIAVSFADLDISHAKGRETLEHRVAMAADKVCAGRPSNLDLSRLHYYEACRVQAMAGANQQLAEAYQGRQLAQASITVGPGKR